MKNVLIALFIMVSVFAGLSSIAPPKVAALEDCSVTLATPYINGGSVSTWGKFSCPAPSSPRIRYLQICLYQNGVKYSDCNYGGVGIGASMKMFEGCPAYSASTTARFTAWVWFQDQYGATTTKWSGNSYLYRRCY